MKVKVFDQKGKEKAEATIKDSVFKADVNEKVLSQYVFAYLSNQRQGNAHTKGRADVAGSRKKPWRQKGTGRARVGTQQNPLWRGGGVAFGPLNTRNWKKSLNKKFKQAALRQSLSNAVAQKNLKLVDSITLDSAKALTKQAQTIREAFGNPKKITVITNELNNSLVQAVSNLQNTKAVFVKDLNAYDVINGGLILIEDDARKFLETKLDK